MASGRRDYWIGLDDGKAAFAVYQTPVFAIKTATVAASDSDILTMYTVPAGYVFYMTGLWMSCSTSGHKIASFKIDAVVKSFTYWDTNFTLPVTDGGIFTADEEEVITILLSNLDADVQCGFYVCITGYITDKYN